MEKQKDLASAPDKNVSIGIEVEDIYFNSTYGIVRVDKIEHKEDDIYIHMSSTLDGISWERRSPVELGYQFKSWYTKVDHIPGKSVPQIIEELNKDVIKSIQDPSFLDIDNELDEETTALIKVEGKERYEDMITVLEAKKRRVEIIRVLAKEKLDALLTVRDNLQKQLSRVMRVVDVLELYLGVSEEIFQLTAGVPESEDHPICIRQLILFMDEEAAIGDIVNDTKGMVTIEGDIDWMNVEAFDKWILESSENLDQVLPEKKGIVAIKPSRQDRGRYGNAYESASHKERNAKTYLLVRNGENLYRIWINDTMGENFFPTLAESKNIEELFEEASHSWDKEKAEDMQISNIRNALLLQGIIDRTDILRPYPKEINFTEASTYGKDGLIKLIRDAEITLPSGRPSFNEWKDEMNEKIERGTRIFNAGIPWMKDGYPERYAGSYYNWFPPAPSPGIYSIDSIVERRIFWSDRSVDALKVLYNPGDTVYSGYYDSHERTRRISFLFFKDDSWVLNYDLIDVKDILFYLGSRIERQSYLKLMPVLRQILILREKEIEQENMFIDLVANEMYCSSETVKEAVVWWKNKVIFKRPLDEDDKKAWRMIKKHISKLTLD